MTQPQQPSAPGTDLQSPERWEEQIRQFENRATNGDDPQDGIVFIGSSTFTRWNLSLYFQPTNDLVNRGFGGSQLWEVAHFAPRLIPPLKPRGIFLYAGDNDLAAGRTPQQVAESYDQFRAATDRHNPSLPIVFVSIKPSPLRHSLMPLMDEANQLVMQRVKADPSGRLRYLDVHQPMLDEQGNPREELFVEDRLHLSHEGYLLWAELFQAELSRLRQG